MDQQSVDKIVLQFLQTTVLNLGTVSIQNLTGHFSQLPVDIRKKFNSTKAEVKKFLLAYPEIFVVNDESVSILQKKDPLNLVDTSVQCEIPAMVNDDDSNDDDGAKKRQLIDCKGKLIRVFDVYGFIEFSSPSISTSIYFDVVCFEDGQYENLSKVKVGDEVNFCAKQSVGHKAPYRATKVWRTGYTMSLQGSERCYSSSTSLASQDSYQSELLYGSGKVMKITTNYGFIKPTGKTQGNVFFFRTKLQLPNVEEVKNLDEVLKEGDYLYFSAIPSRKKNADAPWEAIKVARTPLENPWNGLFKHSNKSSIIHTGSTSSTDGSYHSLGVDAEPKNDDTHIYNQVGNITQLSNHEPIIRFGKNETALVPPNVIYKNNKLLQEYIWEIDEGTKVEFNAEYVNTNWKAVLVWIGDKPQLSNKKSRKKKTTEGKESTVSDLCEISLYDDQSDDGIWRTSPNIDTCTWDEENNENWPALEPPVLTKCKAAEKMKLPKSENNSKISRSDRINTVSSDHEEKHNGESSTSSSAIVLPGDYQEVITVNNSKRNRKKKNICDSNASSYATVVTTLSKDSHQNKNDSGSDIDKIQRYKMNNGWEEDSFDTNSEKWPALSESSILPISSNSKDTFNRIEDINAYINENQCFLQEKLPNERNVNSSDFVDRNNDIPENYYSDSDEFGAQEIESAITYNKDLSIINSQSLDLVNNPNKEKSCDKFKGIMGTVINIQKHFGFIKAEELDLNLPFYWEQAFCDGRLVSKFYTDLSQAFNEFDRVNFTYCSMIDESGKEWKNILQVWKGKKPLQATSESIEQLSSDNLCSQQKETDTLIYSSDTGMNCEVAIVTDVLKDYSKTTVNSPLTTITSAHVIANKNDIEDSGVCMEELETCESEDNKAVNGSSSSNSSALNKHTSSQKEKEIGTEIKKSDPSSVSSDVSVNQTDEPSQIDNIKHASSNSFLNYVFELTHPSKTESLSSKESLSHMQLDGTQIFVRSQETQTDNVTCDQGTQTFITGTVLSIEVFPQ